MDDLSADAFHLLAIFCLSFCVSVSFHLKCSKIVDIDSDAHWGALSVPKPIAGSGDGALNRKERN